MPLNQISCVLFDIDGTLLSANGAGHRAFSRALLRTFGLEEPMRHVSFAGATDLMVFDQIMTEKGVTPSREERETFFVQMAEELEAALDAGDPFLYEGVQPVVAQLAADRKFLLGLVTGNAEQCARIKLGRFELDHLFPFGGFGYDHADRNKIAGYAVERAHRHAGSEQRIHRFYLVGDTPADIRAAQAIRAVSVGVTTGFSTGRALRAAGADFVIDDMTALPRILSADRP